MLINQSKKDHVLGMLNKVEILVLVWIRKIASAKIGATDNLMILLMCYSPSFAGIEFVTITWSSFELSIFWRALPTK